LLNKRIYEKLNEHLLNKLNIISQLRSNKINNLGDIQYELFLTPDIQKVKLFTKLIELKKKMVNFESKIGNWDTVIYSKVLKFIEINLFNIILLLI
jgi:hypothetical protein